MGGATKKHLAFINGISIGDFIYSLSPPVRRAP